MTRLASKERISVTKLQDIPETLLIPLYMRYLESKTEDGLFFDQSSIDAVSKIEYDFTKFDNEKEVQLGIAARTLVFDMAVESFLKKHPDSLIVHIACGLDNRFIRMDKCIVNWIDFDLPEVIEIRKQLFEQNQRLSFVSGDILRESWWDFIPKNIHTLFVMEGIFFTLIKTK